MKEYEEYLRKLQSKMDFSDGVDDKAVEQYLERRDEYRLTSNLLALCALLLIPVLWYLGVSSYGDDLYVRFLFIIVMLVMLILGIMSIVNGSVDSMLVSIWTMCLVITSTGKKLEFVRWNC